MLAVDLTHVIERQSERVCTGEERRGISAHKYGKSVISPRTGYRSDKRKNGIFENWGIGRKARKSMCVSASAGLGSWFGKN